MRTTTMLPALLAALLLGGCNDLTVGDLNNPGVESLQNSPTRSGVLNLATGLQVGSRYNLSEPTGYNILLGMLGREIYNLACSDPRFFGEFIVGPLDGGSPAFGGNLFTLRYANIRTGNILLRAITKLPNDPLTGLTAAEKEGITGYTQTLQAYDFLRVINTRDSLGAPVDVDIDPTGPPAAIKTRAEVFQHITNLLDSAVAHLAAGGSTFPFPMSTGYAGFDTPPTFIKFNRALRARVAAYLGTPTEYAIMQRLLETFPDSTFLDPSGAPGTFATGVYHSFSAASGDLLNVLFDPPSPKPIAITINPALVANAQLQVASTTPDKRIMDKKTDFAPALSCSGVSSTFASNVYTSNTAPIPIIRNEELILLRAEERIFTGNTAGAVSDLNVVRIGAGNLGPYTGLTDQTSLVSELLYNRLYSLLFEGGHRWIDLRRFKLLTTIPQESTTGGLAKRFSRMPFPTNECLIRNPPPGQGCSPDPGF